MKFFILNVLFLFKVGLITAADNCNEKKIEINGQTKPLLNHIVLCMTFEPDHLNNIDFFRYENGRFTLLECATLTKQELDEIKKNNYTYIPFYTREERSNSYQDVGAIVIGTSDPDTAEKICGIRLAQMLNLKDDKK